MDDSVRFEIKLNQIPHVCRQQCAHRIPRLPPRRDTCLCDDAMGDHYDWSHCRQHVPFLCPDRNAVLGLGINKTQNTVSLLHDTPHLLSTNHGFSNTTCKPRAGFGAHGLRHSAEFCHCEYPVSYLCVASNQSPRLAPSQSNDGSWICPPSTTNASSRNAHTRVSVLIQPRRRRLRRPGRKIRKLKRRPTHITPRAHAQRTRSTKHTHFRNHEPGELPASASGYLPAAAAV